MCPAVYALFDISAVMDEKPIINGEHISVLVIIAQKQMIFRRPIPGADQKGETHLLNSFDYS